METPSESARRRLYPSLTDPAYLPLRSRRHIFSSWASDFTGQLLTVLDVGGRYQPYRPLFGTSIRRYFAIDLLKTEFVSVIGNAEHLPFQPASLDLVIATQVFEYFRDPCKAANEIYNALRPGGTLLASFAACTPRFVDEERWRFTRSGIKQILDPFASVEIVPELSSVGGVVRTVNLAFDTFVRYDTARRLYRLTACPILNLLGLGLERFKLTDNDQFTTNYSVKAVK